MCPRWGIVGLIWRGLANVDGALQRAWATLRPFYKDSTIATEATALHADLDLRSLPAVHFLRAALHSDGIIAKVAVICAAALGQ